MPRGIYKRKPEHGAAVSEGQKNSDAIKAKNEAQKGIPHTPEHCAALSKAIKNSESAKAAAEAKTGVALSPEHIAAAIKGQKESGIFDVMRGGHDLVRHHYIYDESDLSLNTIQMTRSDHTSLHNVLRKLGYIFPHINVKR